MPANSAMFSGVSLGAAWRLRTATAVPPGGRWRSFCSPSQGFRVHMKRILLTGDFLRPLEGDPHQSESVRRIRWFEDLLSPSLAAVTDLPVERLACEGALRLDALYAASDLAPSLDRWAQLFAGPIEGRLADRLVDLCRDAIVISIELPPSVAAVLRSADIPVIDASVDAHRFLYDIPLAWRSTNADVRQAINAFRVTSFEIRWRAGQIKAKTR